jgi:signal transduction histidine kinase
MFCEPFSDLKFLFFTDQLSPLLYYSHLPTVGAALFLGFFILRKNKTLSSKILFTLILLFSLWTILNLFLWTNPDSRILMMIWSFFGIISSTIFIASIYFVYVFIEKKDVSLKIKMIWLVMMLPLLLFITNALVNFNITNCEALEYVNYTNYYYLVGLASFVWTLSFSIYKYFKIKDKEESQKIILLTIGISLFLVSFFVAGYYASLIDNFELEQYGLFGMTIFMAFLAFIIVKFKAFNIKLLGAQALVWAMIILIGSQFLFIQTTINKILNSITFVAVSISGLILVRSIKKVDYQRDLLQTANQNQQSLLHFITHQVKGYMTKSRNIFDGIVVGDYGEANSKVMEMAKYGFDSDTRAVETVLAILKASDLKTGKIEFKKEKANLSAIVAEIIDSRKDLAKEKNIDFTFEIEPNIYTQVDILHIKEVFKNLIINAILYTQKGTIHVVLKREKGKIRFAVIDTGLGLSTVDKSKLFTEGGKGEVSIGVNVDSTGYGLYIAKQIIDQHNGTIGAQSEGRDKGSEFFVILPDVQ